MINITANGRTLDLYDDQIIQLSSTLADVRDIVDKSTMFSTGIKIPCTPNNNEIFGFLNNINVFDDINVNLKIPCTISVNDFMGIEGDLQIVSTKVSQGDEYYDCNLLGKNNDIFSGVKNLYLEDIVSLSGLTHGTICG